VRWRRLWRTRRPVTFNDKVRYKLLRDHRPLMVDFADKAAMRRHVGRLVGVEHLPVLHALLDDADGVLTAPLPREYVLKPTHGSGACVIVHDSAPHDATLPPAEQGWCYSEVRPAGVDDHHLRDVAAGWLRLRYGRGPNHEWAYGRARRRLLVEELLRGADGSLPADVKLFVFHQRCRFVQVDSDRFGERTRDFFDRDGQPLPLTGGLPRGLVAPPPQEQLAQMVEIAERLGAGTDFVRVDLYGLPGRIVVGELTSSPAGGDSPFDPPTWNTEFGRTWTVPRRYR